MQEQRPRSCLRKIRAFHACACLPILLILLFDACLDVGKSECRTRQGRRAKCYVFKSTNLMLQQWYWPCWYNWGVCRYFRSSSCISGVMHYDFTKLHVVLDLDVLHLSIVRGASLGRVVQRSGCNFLGNCLRVVICDSVVLQAAGLRFAVLCLSGDFHCSS